MSFVPVATEEVFSPSKPTYDYCFLEYYDAQINRQVPTIRRNPLPPSYTTLSAIPLSSMTSVTAGNCHNEGRKDGEAIFRDIRIWDWGICSIKLLKLCILDRRGLIYFDIFSIKLLEFYILDRRGLIYFDIFSIKLLELCILDRRGLIYFDIFSIKLLKLCILDRRGLLYFDIFSIKLLKLCIMDRSGLIYFDISRQPTRLYPTNRHMCSIH